MYIIRDCVEELNEFELPVPVSKLSYDSIMLGFAIETGCEALLPRTAFLARFSFCRWKRRSQNGAASLLEPSCRISRGVAHAHHLHHHEAHVDPRIADRFGDRVAEPRPNVALDQQGGDGRGGETRGLRRPCRLLTGDRIQLDSGFVLTARVAIGHHHLQVGGRFGKWVELASIPGSLLDLPALQNGFLYRGGHC
jgi:hypothetical protein